eukprot:Amastigsp_a508481_1324.p4 type:complete len:102 gc:universal Amastigsp_a508481_1324:387-82(-)
MVAPFATTTRRLGSVKSVAVGVLRFAGTARVRYTLLAVAPCALARMYDALTVWPIVQVAVTVVTPAPPPHGPVVLALPDPVPPPERGCGETIQPWPATLWR